MLGEPAGSDPDSRLCYRPKASGHPLGKRWFRHPPGERLPAMGTARGYGSGWSRQGIARHVPPCPAALHLDCPNLRQKCAAKDCWRRSARNEKNTSRQLSVHENNEITYPAGLDEGSHSRAARRWHLLVGVRWQRFQCRVAALYFQRVSLPVQWWVACGRPPQFRPRLPWWQPFVWRWLVLSGWLR